MAIATAGQRDKRVTIQQRPSADTVDEDGFPVDGAWTLLGTEDMAKRDIAEMGSSERFAAAQLAASFDTEWEFPFRSDMDPEVLDVPKVRRLVFRGRTYDIVHASATQGGQAIKVRTLAASGVA